MSGRLSGLVTVSNQPVPKPCDDVLSSVLSLVTVANRPVLQPLRMKPDEQRWRSCFNDPSRADAQPMRISTGVNSRSNSGMLALARNSYDTATVANMPNGGTRIQKRGSCRGEPLRRPPREKAFAFHPFDRRCDSPDRATENRRYVYLYTFACRVESAGSPTQPSISH